MHYLLYLCSLNCKHCVNYLLYYEYLVQLAQTLHRAYR